MPIARRFLISGIVQGVGYRYFALRAAKRHGIVGYVRNLHDGRVEVVARASPRPWRPSSESCTAARPRLA